MKKNFEMLGKLGEKLVAIEEAYSWFKPRTWYFDDKKYRQVCDSLNEYDANEFFMDLRKIDLPAEGRKY